MTARNDRPLIPKQATRPYATRTPPPIIGPIIWARLNWIEFSAIAFGSVERGTSDGIIDWNAGPPKAWARPVKNDSARMWCTCTTSKNTMAVSVSAATIWRLCEAIRR